MSVVRGGRTLYGLELGVLMLDTIFPRIPGDVGSALTWPFPVHFKVVKGADTSRIMGKDPDPTLLAPFLDGARELEALGVRAITTSCGFVAIFQKEMAEAVSVPVITSALLQVPQVARMVAPRSVGILTERHFNGAGWSARDIPVHITAMPDDAVFPTVFIDQKREADVALLEREMVACAERAVRDHPDLGALVLECTNFVPFSKAMTRATGLPVYDLFTAVMQTHLATRTAGAGW
ncbi:MAG: aspartate/glutamate racemase family protein [Chloroflexi bacterium]|nr:aspartate/glutamate racemase family protein [Chloroflexota bacterium]